MIHTIAVDIKERAYRITIKPGLLQHVADIIQPLVPKNTRIALMASKTVEKYYRETVQRTLEHSGYRVKFFPMPTGEPQKNLDTVSKLYDTLIEHTFDRSCLIIALGGGVVGDTAGFVAATLYRGIPFIQIPTTLLSQVDSSVGGKVGVNHPNGKNLIGAFYQPKVVLIDPMVLKTLEMRERISGFGEMVKYGFIRDAAFVDFCMTHIDELLQLKDMDKIVKAIRRSVQIKVDIVVQDEHESGLRMLLNFGHTIGHAIEQSEGYGKFTHGEAVIIGMCAALKISDLTDYLDSDIANTYIHELKKIPLEGNLKHLNTAAVLAALSHDKKTRNQQPQFVLLEDIGHPVIVNDVPEEIIRETVIWLKNSM